MTQPSASIAAGCWTAADNTHLHLVSSLDEKDRTRQLKEGGGLSGFFPVDFVRVCRILGVVPHPKLAAHEGQPIVGPGSAYQRKKEEDERKQKLNEEKEAEANPAPTPVQPAATGSNRPGKGKGKGGAAAAEKPISVGQKAANEANDQLTFLSASGQPPAQPSEVSVRGWEIDLGSMLAVTLTLPHCKSLNTLRFWKCNLSSRAILTLTDGLKNSSITRLYIDANPEACDRSKGEEGSLALSTLMAPSSPLQLLSLRSNGIDDAICSDIMRVLQANKHLQVLDLWDNEIGDESVADIARMLGLNTNLQSLNLSKNLIGNEGSKLLSATFSSIVIHDKEEAKNLKKSGFRITTIKNRTLRDANNSLRYLGLSYNYIEEEGLLAWVDVCNEQVKYNPGRGMMMIDGVEVMASTLIPANPAAAAAAAPSAKEKESKPPMERKETSRGTGASTTPRTGRKPSTTARGKGGADSSAASLSSPPGISSGAAKDDDLRYPGQVNNLTQIDLSNQYSHITQHLWQTLRYTPLIHWIDAEEDGGWNPEGNLNTRARKILQARQEAEERVREAEQKAAEEAALVAAQTAKEEAEAAAAAEAAEAEKRHARQARKEQRSSKRAPTPS